MSIVKKQDGNKVIYSMGEEAILQSEIIVENNKAVVKIEGAIKTAAAPSFDEIVKNAMDNYDNIQLDFNLVTYIASAGLRVLLNMQQFLDEQDIKSVEIINIQSKVKEVFVSTGFVNILNIRD